MENGVALSNGANIIIRELGRNDLDALKYLFCSLEEEKNINIYPNITRSENAKSLVKNCGKKKSILIVVAGNSEGRLVGFASFFLLKGYARLNLLAIIKEWRGKGLGKAIMEHSLSILSSSSARRVGLAVNNDNFAAIKLYNELLFRETSENISWIKFKLLIFSMVNVVGLMATAILLYQILYKTLFTSHVRLIEMERAL